MRKWMAVLLVCGFALLAGACSQKMPGTYKAKPAAAHGVETPAPQAHGEEAAPVEPGSVPEPPMTPPDAGVLRQAGAEMDALAGLFCDAALNSNPDVFFKMLHPTVLAFLKKGYESGEDKISIDMLKAEMKQQMLMDPALECRAAGAVITRCEEHIVEMYGQLELPLEECGRMSIAVTLKQNGPQQAELGTAKVNGKWYLNDM